MSGCTISVAGWESKNSSSNCFPVDRMSSGKWWANQYQALRAAVAYALLETMRGTAQRKMEYAPARCQTPRLRLLKFGAVMTRDTRTVAVRLSSICPDQHVLRELVNQPIAG